MLKWTRTVVNHPWVTVLAVVSITLWAIFQLRLISMDPDITDALPKKIPAKRLYDKMGEIFPSKEFIFLGIRGEDVFSPQHLEDVWILTQTLEDIPEIYTVMSPTNISVIEGTEEGMSVEDILARPPENENEIAEYKNRLFSNDLALGNLVSEDGSMLGIMILLKNTTDADDFVETFIPLVEDLDRDTDLEYILAGKPVVSHYISIGMQRDMSTFFMGGLLIIFLLLLVIYRNLRGILLPLSVVIFSVLWTLGLMATLGVPMSHSTEILPILIMAIAVADSIHILTHYYAHADSGTNRKAIVLATMEDMNAPVIMTSLTTMAGFIALGTVGVESILSLGVFTAAGVLFALVVSLSFVPALLSVMNIPKRIRKNTRKSPVSTTLMVGWGNLLIRNKRVFYPFLIVVLILSVWGFSRLEHRFSSTENFPPDHPVRIANELLNEHFAGTTSFQIMVEGDSIHAIKHPVILQDMDDLKELALKLEHVGDVQSLADFIKRFNKVLHNDQEEFYRIPDEAVVVEYPDWEQRDGEWVEIMHTDTVAGHELIAQYLALYEMSGKPDDMANIVDYNYQNAKISILMDTDNQAALRSIDNRLETFIDDHFPGATVAVTGMAKLVLVVDELIVSGQISSILFSLLLVWIITSFMFRSPIVGLFNTIPLFFALLLNFTIMGLSRIPVNLETMVTSSIAIGVGVDYAIHFVYRYRRKVTESGDFAVAVRATMEDSGIAIAFNSFVVAAGFSVIALSQFVAIMHMGVLISLTMLTAAFGALTVLPWLFVLYKPKALIQKSKQTQVDN